MVRNLTQAALTVAYIYGHDIRSEERYKEILLILGIWAGVLNATGETVMRLSRKLVEKSIQRMPGTVFGKINRRVGFTLLTKYGTKRGGVAVGRVIPFGVGVVIGGGFNLFIMNSLNKAAIKYYNDVIPAAQEQDYGDKPFVIVEEAQWISGGEEDSKNPPFLEEDYILDPSDTPTH